MKSGKTIDLARRIVGGQGNLAFLESSLKLKDNLSKPLMRQVFKDELGQVGFSVCQTLVTRFTDSFGFSNKLNSVQIETLTVDTLEHFNYESLEDIILFFKMARSGKLGVTNRGIDSNLIFGDWFPKYMELKSVEREKTIEKKKKINKIDPFVLEKIKYTYEKAQKRKDIEKVYAYVDKLTKNFDRQMLEDTITDWEKDDKKIHFVYILKKKRRSIK